MLQTVIVSTRLVADERHSPLDRVRSIYLSDLQRPQGPAVAIITIAHDPKAAFPTLPQGLEAHEVPLSVGETRVKVTHMERPTVPGLRT